MWRPPSAAGLDVDAFAPRLSFFFNAHSDFFEEIGKFRAARRIWATWMKDRYGAENPKSLMCRFHTQTAGVSLTAQQPENNIARVAIQALSAVMGGTQSLHTDSYDEALALPTEKAARIALRTQQIVAHETGAAAVADPLGGAHYVEWMTDEMERQATEIFDHIEQLGNGSMLEGAYAGIEDGYFVGEIADAAYRFEREVNAGRRIIVGVNEFTEGDDDEEARLLSIGHDTEEMQLKRLSQVRDDRDNNAVRTSLAALVEAARAARRQSHAAHHRRGADLCHRGGNRRPRWNRCSAPMSKPRWCEPMAEERVPIRVVLAKLGLDGHDRGLKVVARTLRDAGMEVIYLGLRQTTDSIVAACEQEDADVIGLSMHNAGHLTLAPRMVQAVAEAELDVPVVIGGIVPADDVPTLIDAGVAAVLGPGASADEVVAAVHTAVTRSSTAR